jgi:predicted acylesterase/phospholipase RssA
VRPTDIRYIICQIKNGVYAWDGGLLSNTPLREVIEASPVNDKRVFLIENYPKKIMNLPEKSVKSCIELETLYSVTKH